MKFLGFLVLAIFAVTLVRSDDCSEERAMECVDNLLEAILEEDSSEETVCRELRTATDCLKDTVQDCFGDERDPELDEGIEELEKLLRDNCAVQRRSADDDDDEEIQKCSEENKGYLSQCGVVALTQLAEMETDDENALMCTMFGVMASCFTERLIEKCGEKAIELARKELSTVPAEVHNACVAAGDTETLQFSFLDSRKKK